MKAVKNFEFCIKNNSRCRTLRLRVFEILNGFSGTLNYFLIR